MIKDFFAGVVEVLRADSFQSPVTNMGVAGKDALTSFVVRPRQPMPPHEAQWLYRDNIYAQRIVSSLPSEALRDGWIVTGANMDLLEHAYKRFRIAKKLARCAKLARRDGDAYLWIVTNTLDQRAPLDLSRPVQLVNFVVLDKQECIPGEWQRSVARDTDEPEFYHIAPVQQSDQSGAVHASRIIHLTGREVLSTVDRLTEQGNDSVLHSTREQVKRWDILEQSYGHLVNEVKISVIKTEQSGHKVDDAAAASREAAKLKRVGAFKSLLNMIILGVGETFEQTSANLTGLKDLTHALAWGITSAAEQPLAKLFGVPPAGLSTDDEAGARNWADAISSYRQDQLTPALERIHELIFAAWNVTTEASVGWTIEWPGLDEDAQRDAEIERASKIVGLVAQLVSLGVPLEVALAAMTDSGNWVVGVPDLSALTVQAVTPSTSEAPVSAPTVAAPIDTAPAGEVA